MISQRKVHEHGHVVLEDMLGSELDILNNAKVSFDSGSTELDAHGKGVLRFLMEEKHGSPWESVVFRFDIKLPIFVMRELVRHRISSINEHSQRYSPAMRDFYIPDVSYVREQVGKPGNYTFDQITDQATLDEALNILESSQQQSFDAYDRLVELGIAKELARTVIPVGCYTRIKWTVNLRSLLNFLELRNHKDAQVEIRDYARCIEELVEEQLPYAIELFNRFGRVAP